MSDELDKQSSAVVPSPGQKNDDLHGGKGTFRQNQRLFEDIERFLLKTSQIRTEKLDEQIIEHCTAVMTSEDASNRMKQRAAELFERLCARRDKTSMHGQSALVALCKAQLQHGETPMPVINQQITVNNAPAGPLPPDRQAVKDDFDQWIENGGQDDEGTGLGLPQQQQKDDSE